MAPELTSIEVSVGTSSAPVWIISGDSKLTLGLENQLQCCEGCWYGGDLGPPSSAAVVGVLPQLSDDAELSLADVALERPVAGVRQLVVDPALSERVLAAAVVAAVPLLRAAVVGVRRAPVRLQSPRARERLAARRTDVRADLAVDACVLTQLARLSEPLRTLVAGERLLPGMDSLVLDQLSADDELARALAARVRLVPAMRPPVVVQRRRRRHDALALIARIRPRTGGRRFSLPPRTSDPSSSSTIIHQLSAVFPVSSSWRGLLRLLRIIFSIGPCIRRGLLVILTVTRSAVSIFRLDRRRSGPFLQLVISPAVRYSSR